jgi:outer membrane protein X
LICAFGGYAQKGSFRVGLDLGYTIPSNGGGVLFSIEPKYNKDNMNGGCVDLQQWFAI